MINHVFKSKGSCKLLFGLTVRDSTQVKEKQNKNNQIRVRLFKAWQASPGLVRFSVYIVCPSVFELKLPQATQNISSQKNIQARQINTFITF